MKDIIYEYYQLGMGDPHWHFFRKYVGLGDLLDEIIKLLPEAPCLKNGRRRFRGLGRPPQCE